MKNQHWNSPWEGNYPVRNFSMLIVAVVAPDCSDNANEIDNSIQTILSGTLPTQRISPPSDSVTT